MALAWSRKDPREIIAGLNRDYAEIVIYDCEAIAADVYCGNEMWSVHIRGRVRENWDAHTPWSGLRWIEIKEAED